MSKELIHDLVKGRWGLALNLLHDTSPMAAICGTKCSVLQMGGVDPDVVVPIGKVNYRSEGVPDNGVHVTGLIRDVGWLHNSIAISGHEVMQESCFLRLISLRYHEHSTCRGVTALVNAS